MSERVMYLSVGGKCGWVGPWGLCILCDWVGKWGMDRQAAREGSVCVLYNQPIDRLRVCVVCKQASRFCLRNRKQPKKERSKPTNRLDFFVRSLARSVVYRGRNVANVFFLKMLPSLNQKLIFCVVVLAAAACSPAPTRPAAAPPDARPNPRPNPGRFGRPGVAA